MSYYFTIIGTKDNPLFEAEFGTSRAGGDGVARFREEARHMNQFIVHSSLDIVEEVQWGSGQMYLRTIDRFHHLLISCFLTPTNVKFLLLIDPTAYNPSSSSGRSSASLSRQSAYTTASMNPTIPATEEAIRNFFVEVYDNYVKTVMSPFYVVNMPIRSPVFRQRVLAGAKRYL